MYMRKPEEGHGYDIKGGSEDNDMASMTPQIKAIANKGCQDNRDSIMHGILVSGQLDIFLGGMPTSLDHDVDRVAAIRGDNAGLKKLKKNKDPKCRRKIDSIGP